MNRRSVRASAVLLLLAACSAPAGEIPEPIRQQIQEAYEAFAAAHPGLASSFTSDDFRHPTEREMIGSLMNKNPGIRDLAPAAQEEQLRKVKEQAELYLLHAVAAGPDQYPQVHAAAERAKARLGITNEVTVFVTNNAEMRADVFGIPKHGHVGNSFGPAMVLLTSGMTRAMAPAELDFVIGRELGHIAANHRFYTALAFRYQQETGKLPVLFPDEYAADAEGIAGSMQLFFERGPEARRLSELSADRAGALVCEDPRAALSALAKIARGDLEGTAGFDLDAYLEQIRQAMADMSPKDARVAAAEQGFVPYMLTRVSELHRFVEGAELQRLRDRRGANPFLLELENLERIGTAGRNYEARLEALLKDPKTRRLDPLVKRKLLGELEAAVSARQAAAGTLAELMVDHLELVGLEVVNPLFDDLVAHLRRTGDARPFAGLLKLVGLRLDAALQRPDTTNEGREELEAKKALLEEVKDLAPEEDLFAPDAENPVPWTEHVDLPRVLDETMAKLSEAAAGKKSVFLQTVEDLRPVLRDTGLKLLASLSPEETRDVAAILDAHGGRLSVVVGEVLAAGGDEAKLVALYDRYFDEAKRYLKLVPMFLIRSRLKRVARFDV